MMIFVLSIAGALRFKTQPRTEVPVVAETLDFVGVYKEHFSFAWRSLRALGVHSGSIDDAVQEVFIIVHRRLNDYQPTASVRSWIFGIVRRVAKDFRRTVQRRGVQVSIADEHIAAGDAHADVTVQRHEALRLVEAFVDTLDDERRAVFVLSELEEMPVQEIAQALKMNPNTLYSRLKIIKQDFSKFLARRLGEEQGVFS
jgi:RNA polymerase sigma-70 factor (ECF subfamily)